MTRKPDAAANPILVEVIRGGASESFHRGAAVIFDAAGAQIAAWGDVDRPVFPRSAIKLLQALCFIETGAAEALAACDAEIALACGSHSGAPIHARTAEALLDRAGPGPAALECGAHLPLGRAETEAMLRAGGTPTPLHNNCSGKHAAMIATAAHLGEPVAGYTAPGHPVQARVRRTIEDMAGVDLANAPVATDGCAIPTHAMPLASMARAMARLADPSGLPPARAQACRRIQAAMTAQPEMVAGAGRCDSAVIAATAGAVLAKTGAEGVYCAALPGRGLGLALKIDDGTRRAAEVALLALLGYLNVDLELADFARPRILTRRGMAVGEVRPATGWLNS